MNAILQVILQITVFGIGPVWLLGPLFPSLSLLFQFTLVILAIVYYCCYITIIVFYEYWKSGPNSFTSTHWIKMKFKDWYKLYKVNPKYWDTSLTGSWGGPSDSSIIYKGPSGNKYVYFSFFGYCRFLIWKLLGNSDKNNAGKNDSLKDILTDTQEYIENVLKSNNKEVTDHGF